MSLLRWALLWKMVKILNVTAPARVPLAFRWMVVPGGLPSILSGRVGLSIVPTGHGLQFPEARQPLQTLLQVVIGFAHLNPEIQAAFQIGQAPLPSISLWRQWL